MAFKSPRKFAPESTSDREVVEFLQNAVIGLTNWKALKDAKLRGPLLRRYTEAFLEDARDSVTRYRRDDGTTLDVPIQAISDHELALCLQLGVMLLLFRHILPEDSPLQDSTVGAIVGGKVRL